MRRVVFAVALAFVMFFADGVVRFFLVLYAPHLAPLVIPVETSKLTVHMDYNGYVVTEDYAGTLYHIHDNQRLTVGQPSNYTHTVWIFGNSGAFGLYVADAETVESQLQLLLNKEGYHWRVVNVADSGEYISGELAHLRATNIQKGDLVVFDDSGMDLVYGRCTDNRYAVLQAYCQLSYTLFDANAESRHTFEHLADEAQVYSTQHGARFVHFIQPTPYPQFVKGVDGIHLTVPNSTLMDAYHLTTIGEQIEASQIFDVLTLI